MLNLSCDSCQTPAPNDRIGHHCDRPRSDGSFCPGIIQGNLSPADAMRWLERESLTPEQLCAIAQALYKEWGWE